MRKKHHYLFIIFCLFSSVVNFGSARLVRRGSTLVVELGSPTKFPSLDELGKLEDTDNDDVDWGKKTDTTKTTITFEGSHTYINESPLPPSSSPRKLISFFQNAQNGEFLQNAGGDPIQVVPMTSELFEEWKAQSKIVKSTEPTKNDSILSIQSTLPLLPGLSIKAISTMGCCLVIQPGSSLPMYELTLIKDDYIPTGAKPLTWVFNQITGRENNNNNHHQNINSDNDIEDSIKKGCSISSCSDRKTNALTRISVQQSKPGGPLLLQYYGHVKVACSVPSRLIRSMPISKATLEAKVCQSITKQIERDSHRCLDPFRNSLEEYLLGARCQF